MNSVLFSSPTECDWHQVAGIVPGKGNVASITPGFSVAQVANDKQLIANLEGVLVSFAPRRVGFTRLKCSDY
jgi:hypothetical protein